MNTQLSESWPGLKQPLYCWKNKYRTDTDIRRTITSPRSEETYYGNNNYRSCCSYILLCVHLQFYLLDLDVICIVRPVISLILSSFILYNFYLPVEHIRKSVSATVRFPMQTIIRWYMKLLPYWRLAHNFVLFENCKP